MPLKGGLMYLAIACVLTLAVLVLAILKHYWRFSIVLVSVFAVESAIFIVQIAGKDPMAGFIAGLIFLLELVGLNILVGWS